MGDVRIASCQFVYYTLKTFPDIGWDRLHVFLRNCSHYSSKYKIGCLRTMT